MFSNGCSRGPQTVVEIQNGGADRDQTDDLVVANDALYQLSYCPPRKGSYLKSLPGKSTPISRSAPWVVRFAGQTGKDHLSGTRRQQADNLHTDMLADVRTSSSDHNHRSIR